MNVRAIKTAESVAAVNRIKAMTMKEVKDIDTSIPDVFIEKRNYMQSDVFLKDEHNRKMFDLIDDMMIIRDKITAAIAKINETSLDKYIQGINGYTRIKPVVEKNFSKNFVDRPTFAEPLENMYKTVRTQLSLESKRAVK